MTYEELSRALRDHLRKLPAIQAEVNRFVSVKPLQPGEPLPFVDFHTMKAAFDRQHEWDDEYQRLSAARWDARPR